MTVLLTYLPVLITGCGFSASAKVNKKIDLAAKYISESKYEEAVLAYREEAQYRYGASRAREVLFEIFDDKDPTGKKRIYPWMPDPGYGIIP